MEWLRHSGASLAYAASKDILAVARRLGHTSTRMVDGDYVELLRDLQAGCGCDRRSDQRLRRGGDETVRGLRRDQRFGRRDCSPSSAALSCGSGWSRRRWSGPRCRGDG